MSTTSKIYSPRELAKLIRNKFSVNVPESAIHRFAENHGYHLRREGGKKGYLKAIATDVLRFYNELIGAKPSNNKPMPKPKPDYNPDQFIEPDRSHRFFDDDDDLDENIIKRCVTESINEFLISENMVDDGFSMSFRKDANGNYKLNDPSMVKFTPDKKGYAETNIFKDGSDDFAIRYMRLPKSGIDSINLYNIKNMNINKAIKHHTNVSGGKINVGNSGADESLEYFKKRSAFYIASILRKMGVVPDVITSPQSSSRFNADMLNLIAKYYPKGDVFVMPNSMRKDPRSITINYSEAAKLGMTDEEIAKLQNRIDNMKKDEDIRDFRRKIENLKAEIESILTHKRGRPPKAVSDKRKEIDAYNTIIRNNRRRGSDPTVDRGTGNIKSMQIKSLDDRQRKAIDGLFVFNDNQYPSKTFNKNGESFSYSPSMRLAGKTVLVFDDNLSSGATLDMVCDSLLKMGVKQVIPITLGIIPATAYTVADRIRFS